MSSYSIFSSSIMLVNTYTVIHCLFMLVHRALYPVTNITFGFNIQLKWIKTISSKLLMNLPVSCLRTTFLIHFKC